VTIKRPYKSIEKIGEVRCKRGGSSRSWRRLLPAVLAWAFLSVGICGESLWAQPLSTTPSWSGPLNDLKQTLEQLKTKSLMQERLIASLQNDNAELKRLSIEQQTDLQRQQEMLLRSQSSLTAASQSWTSYLSLSEEAIRESSARASRAERSARRNRLVWQIGIPAAALAGLVLGVVL
jgi:hypothetical protein